MSSTPTRAEIEAQADLSEFSGNLREMALDCLVERDPGFLVLVTRGNQYHIRVVSQNVQLLKSLGMFEAALLYALTSTRTNNRREAYTLAWLFEMADREKLRAAGKPLPGPGPFTLYRGIAGVGVHRHPRGFSWTGSLGMAVWFAERLGLKNPHVLRVTVPASCVLAYLPDDRKEDEYVTQLPREDIWPVRVPESEWRPALETWNTERQAANEREKIERKRLERERRAALTPVQKAVEDRKRHLWSRQLDTQCKKLNAQLGASFAEGHSIEEALAAQDSVMA